MLRNNLDGTRTSDDCDARANVSVWPTPVCIGVMATRIENDDCRRFVNVRYCVGLRRSFGVQAAAVFDKCRTNRGSPPSSAYDESEFRKINEQIGKTESFCFIFRIDIVFAVVDRTGARWRNYEYVARYAKIKNVGSNKSYHNTSGTRALIGYNTTSTVVLI